MASGRLRTHLSIFAAVTSHTGSMYAGATFIVAETSVSSARGEYGRTYGRYVRGPNNALPTRTIVAPH